jgi:pimeloyl-[acyl-carrier protein] methyl ester esterase
VTGPADLGLILLHGWGMNAAVWAGLPAALGAALDGRPITPIDLPGHGGAPCPPGGAQLDAWADACLTLAPPRAIWLGWSLGGLVAMDAALRAPDRVAALILMTATPRFVRADDWPHAMAAETLEQFHSGLLADPAGTLERFLALQVRGSEASRETLRTLRRELAARPAPDPQALALGLELLRDSDLRGRLAEISCPTLWLYGSHDTLVPAAAGAAVARLIPAARVHTIRGAAHAPFLSHPAETAALIGGFLAGVSGYGREGPRA